MVKDIIQLWLGMSKATLLKMWEQLPKEQQIVKFPREKVKGKRKEDDDPDEDAEDSEEEHECTRHAGGTASFETFQDACPNSGTLHECPTLTIAS